MTAVAYEIMESRSGSEGDKRSETRSWIVKGTSDKDVALDALYAEAPDPIPSGRNAGLRILRVTNGKPPFVDEANDDGIWYFDIEYGSDVKVFEIGDTGWSMNFSGDRVKVNQAISTRYRRKETDNGLAAGVVGNGEDHKNAVNVTDASIKGVDIIAGTLDEREDLVISGSEFTDAYVATLKAAIGTTNNGSVTLQKGTFAQGEVLLVGAQARPLTGGKVKMSFAYKINYNETNLDVGGIIIPDKYGWEYLWAEYKVVKGVKRTVMAPEAVYVCQMYRETDYSLFRNPAGTNWGLV